MDQETDHQIAIYNGIMPSIAHSYMQLQTTTQGIVPGEAPNTVIRPWTHDFLYSEGRRFVAIYTIFELFLCLYPKPYSRN